MKNNFKVGITTLGCKVNQYESEAIAEALEARGFVIAPHTEICDAYVINTCTVTAESDRKARQMIRRMITRNPAAYVLVTGCYSQVSPEEVAEIEGVDYVCGSSNKMSVTDKLSELIGRGAKNVKAEVCVPDLDASGFEQMSIRRFNRTRAYVKIEDGCESKCAYCTIPASRGPIRSKPYGEVIDEVRLLTDNGVREVVLTGIETGSYGKDLPKHESFASLLCAIDEIEGIGRVRTGSLDPTVIKPDFVARIKDLRSLCPHFHLSLQSGSSKTLASMKRKYNAEQAMGCIERLREAMPDVQFTTDVIVGFPGETDADFAETCEFVRKAKFLMIHVFPYSKRKGTVAAQMNGQVPEQIKRERVRILTEISREIRGKILDGKIAKGDPVEVLFESSSKGYAYGHTADFIEVKVKTDKQMHGLFRQVRLLSHDGDVCEGVLAEDQP
ncbi:MAG: tRNA (N(6)-L-threonylcarbamoyladenosine(37)-C(2))-methylthiotransferase MtaB [Clostridia bacterium]|nr:tRNA (N(6)-L-threonylcarbamoyladenosine(37)-C(2))-methylthiotransferase MtaB [Clostridia bacterium]